MSSRGWRRSAGGHRQKDADAITCFDNIKSKELACKQSHSLSYQFGSHLREFQGLEGQFRRPPTKRCGNHYMF